MRGMLLQALLAGIAAGALPAGVLVLRPATPEVLPSVHAGGSVVRDSLKTVPLSLDSLARVAAVRAPFRSSRRPAEVSYDPDRAAVPGAPPPQEGPKPPLSLSGIAWGGGVKPTAVLEGLPGTQGPRAVRAGDVIGGLTVRRIQRGSVIVTGLDTTWTLTVKAPWQ